MHPLVSPPRLEMKGREPGSPSPISVLGTAHSHRLGHKDVPGQLSCAPRLSLTARGSFSFFPSTPGKPQAGPAREEVWRRKEAFTHRRVSDEARLEVNAFFPCPSPGRSASSSQATIHWQAGSIGCGCHHGTDKQACLGTRGLSDLPCGLPGSQLGQRACFSPRLLTQSKHKHSPIVGRWH